MSTRHRFLYDYKIFFMVICALASLMVCAAPVLAANPADWWVDIANDRAANVKTMLARGADPNELSPKGQPAIMQAVRDQSWKVFDILVANRKTAINSVNIKDETPLMYLAVVGQTKRAQDLIRRGAQVNRLGWTPLHYAASTGQLETVKMLLAHKAIVNAPGPDGTTPLMMAAYKGDESVVQTLLKAGADVTTRNLQKYNAADWARLKKHDTLAGTLDALVKNKLAQRTAEHARNQAKAAAGAGVSDTSVSEASDQAGSSTVKAVDIVPAAQPAADSPVAEKGKPKSSDDKSASRYFDLDRFNEKPAP